jgi:predicted dehydrogenase
MSETLRVGVIGCGQIAQIAHLPYLQELPMFEIAAVCDLSPTVVEAVGERFGVKGRYVDYQEMLRKEPMDAVLIANKNHAAPAIAAMEAGRHVLVEKPIALNLKQADEMLQAAESNRVKLMVAYMKRYDPAYEKAQAMVAAMERIHMVRVHDFAGTYQINFEIYDLVAPSEAEKQELAAILDQDRADMLADIGLERSDLLEAHDIMIHLCIHDINVLHGMCGLPEKIACADLFDGTFVTAMLEYDSGLHCLWETGNLVSLVDWDEHIKVWGPDVRIEVRFPFPYLKNAATQLLIDENEDGSAVHKRIIVSYDEAFKREWRHFYDCIRHDREPRTNGREARADLEFAVELMRTAAS